MTYAGSPGWYYVYIYTEGGHNTTTPYTLRVTYTGVQYTVTLHDLHKVSPGIPSRYTVTNQGSSYATTLHEFYDDGGNMVTSFSDGLAVGTAHTYDLAAMPAIPDGYIGSVAISADQPVTATLLDVAAPASSATSPNYATSSPIVVVWAASDDGSGVALTTLWVKVGSAGAWNSTNLTQSGTAGTFSYMPAGGDERYYFATVATDYAGNVEAPPSGDGDTNTLYDITKPISHVQVPALMRTATVSLPWTTSDNLSGVSSTRLWVKVGAQGTWAATDLSRVGTSGTFAYTFAEGEGLYHFATVATDRAGNQESTPSGSGDGACEYQLYRIYLPLGLRDYVTMFEGPGEVEPNDSYLQANGALYSGRDYNGYPDEKDYFSVYLREAGTITIDLTNHTGTGVQLQLFDQSPSGGARARDNDEPYRLQYTDAPAGWYYIYIYSTGGYNTTSPYTLQVSYP